MRLNHFALSILAVSQVGLIAQSSHSNPQWPDVTQQQTYLARRSSSADPAGANRDFRPVAPGETATVLDTAGPGAITHIWFAIASHENMALKKMVLRMYWDGEASPSVETPVGDFFGLGLGACYPWQSAVLSVGPTCGLNSFFNMPFAHHARITITNQGNEMMWGLFYNVDYRFYRDPLPVGTLYFHAQYRQSQPNHGKAIDFANNQDIRADNLTNLDGIGNYVWLDAVGHGQFVGVTMSVLQNQDGWWGEGDEMFFIDGDKRPTIQGTGAEDYFTGAGDFRQPFSYVLAGAPVVGDELAGSRSSVYRFHLESPLPFTQSLLATIEHGNGNARSDNYYSVAYWYQAEPHAPFPPLPKVAQRIPRLVSVGGPGSPLPPSTDDQTSQPYKPK